MFDWDTLTEPARKAADVDVLLASGDELCAGVAVLERVRAVIDAAEGRLLAELDTRTSTEELHGLRTSVWLGREGRIPSHTSATRVRVGHVLADSLHETLARLIDGRISFHHARVLADAVTRSTVGALVAAAEVELLDLAEGMVFDVWARHVAGVVHHWELDNPTLEPDNPNPRRRVFLKLSPTWDGGLRLQGRLGDVAATLTEQTLNRIADELFDQYCDTRTLDPTVTIPTRPELLAEAWVEACRRASNRDRSSGRSPTPEITLVVHADQPDTAYTPHGIRLQDGTTRTLLCDAHWYPVIVDSLGVPLDMGRHIRHVNRAQRRALEHRDGGCVFPGCAHPVNWCDAHHINWWNRDHGTTSTANTALLCRFHHGIAHRQTWNVTLTNDNWTLWTTPHGNTHWGQQHHRTRAAPIPLE